MKKLFIIAALLTFFSTVAYAETVYTPITKDAEVTTIDDVAIKAATPVTEEQTLTLRQLDAQKGEIEKNITIYQGQIAQWQQLLVKIAMMRTAILKEAEKIQLKAVVVPK